MAELRAISTRAEITPTGFTNTYNWGDLKADPIDLLATYFDAFLYVANWATHRVAFRFPRGAIDVDTLRAHADGESVNVRRRRRVVLLEFCSHEGPEDWDEGYGELSRLVPLRANILGGDLRAMYLGWLAGVQTCELEERPEPPVPPGLRELSAPLAGLADFLRLDGDLFTAAAEASEPLSQQTAESEAAWRSWIGSLDEAEKDELLYRFAAGDGSAPGRPSTCPAALDHRHRHARLTRPARTGLRSTCRTAAGMCRPSMTNEANRPCQRYPRQPSRKFTRRV